jgi:hypothetical protein
MALSGSVRDAQDNAAISAVGVSVISGPDTGRSTSTDSSGNFTLGDLKVGPFSVRFMRNGYRVLDRTFSTSENTHIDVQLQRGATCIVPAAANFRVTVSGTTATFAWDYVAGATDYLITLTLPDGRTQTGVATVSPFAWRRLARGRYVAQMTTRDACGEGQATRDVTFTI